MLDEEIIKKGFITIYKDSDTSIIQEIGEYNKFMVNCRINMKAIDEYKNIFTGYNFLISYCLIATRNANIFDNMWFDFPVYILFLAVVFYFTFLSNNIIISTVASVFLLLTDVGFWPLLPINFVILFDSIRILKPLKKLSSYPRFGDITIQIKKENSPESYQNIYDYDSSKFEEIDALEFEESSEEYEINSPEHIKYQKSQSAKTGKFEAMDLGLLCFEENTSEEISNDNIEKTSEKTDSFAKNNLEFNDDFDNLFIEDMEELSFLSEYSHYSNKFYNSLDSTPTKSCEKLREIFLEYGENTFSNSKILRGFVSDLLIGCEDLPAIKLAISYNIAKKVLENVNSTEDFRNINLCVMELTEKYMWDSERANSVVLGFVYAKFGEFATKEKADLLPIFETADEIVEEIVPIKRDFSKIGVSNIVATNTDTVALKSDGTILSTGGNRFIEKTSISCNNKGAFALPTRDEKIEKLPPAWKNIKAISVGFSHILGLNSDGTVCSFGNNSRGQCDVSDWKEISKIFTGDYHSIGISEKGELFHTGDKFDGGLNLDGEQLRFENFCRLENVLSVSMAYSHTVVLLKNGTVHGFGSNKFGQCSFKNWSEIVQISTAENHTVGLRADGKVIATGNFGWNSSEISKWHDIISISLNDNHLVALRSDGKVFAVGNNDFGQCETGNWKKVVAVSAGASHTVAVLSDGVVISVGSNYDEQCELENWILF